MNFFCVLLCASSFFVLFSCSNNLESVTETNEVGYIENYQRDKSNFTRQGWTIITDSAGQLVEKAYYTNSSLDGTRIIFYENGDTNIIENYSQGVFEGTYKVYHENGQLRQLGQYKANEMAGDWLLYYENGQIEEKVRFENNLENGPFTEYHDNGKIAAEGQYADGDNEQGELKIYNEEGILSRIMECKHGRCTTTWELEQENVNKDLD